MLCKQLRTIVHIMQLFNNCSKLSKSLLETTTSNDQTVITSADKADCFADPFAEESTIPEAENVKKGQKSKTNFYRSLTSKRQMDQNQSQLVLKQAAPELAKPLTNLF